MDSYNVSKAWHIGHELAIDVHKLAKEIPKQTALALSVQLRKSSASAPIKLAESLECNLMRQKLQCYLEARKAMAQLHGHLLSARDSSFIDQSTFSDLAKRTIAVHGVLNELVESQARQLKKL